MPAPLHSGSCFQGPQLFFSASILRTTRLHTVFVLIADPPACSTSGLTSRVFRQCLLPAHHDARSASLTSLATHTKHLQTAPADDAGPPCALARKVRSSCPSARPRARMSMYRPHTHTVDCLNRAVVSAALARRSPPFGSGLTRHRRTKGPGLLPDRPTGMLVRAMMWTRAWACLVPVQ